MAGAPALEFNQDVADAICELISTSKLSLRTICFKDGMPSVTTFYKWLDSNKAFAEQYARAKSAQADLIFEEIIEISDHTEEDHTPFTGANVVQRDRLRIDARKWAASKLAPKKYGEKVDLTSDGEKITPVGSFSAEDLHTLLQLQQKIDG